MNNVTKISTRFFNYESLLEAANTVKYSRWEVIKLKGHYAEFAPKDSTSSNVGYVVGRILEFGPSFIKVTRYSPRVKYSRDEFDEAAA